nr:max-binding protein MNT [Zonotrichia albicollis]
MTEFHMVLLGGWAVFGLLLQLNFRKLCQLDLGQCCCAVTAVKRCPDVFVSVQCPLSWGSLGIVCRYFNLGILPRAGCRLLSGKVRDAPLLTVGVSLSEENEKHEKLCVEREQEQKKAGKASVPRANSALSPEAPADDMKPIELKKRIGGVGTREVHNKLEKNRRAHLKECFETLKRNIPNVDDKKTSNLSVLRSALRYIQTLKRKEKEYEHEMERLAREKIATQQRLAELKNELSQWMDVLEIDRIIRQTVQPEDDQASTSTASEGEDNMDEDMEDDRPVNSLPKLTQRQHPELLKAVPPSAAPPLPAVLPPHVSIQQKPHAQPSLQPQALVPPQAIVPAQTHIVAASTVQSTVIAHTATTHASVIQTVNHVIQGPQTKHIAHIAPSTSSPVQLTTAAQPIGHITVHPATINHMAHLGPQLPIYPQPVAVSQPVVSHIAHTISHQQVNGTAGLGQPAVMAKPAVGTQVMHHPQLVGQTVLNPVTMVTMPSFPVSTLKLA